MMVNVRWMIPKFMAELFRWVNYCNLPRWGGSRGDCPPPWLDDWASGYVKIVIENGSFFYHEKMRSFQSYVSLPEGLPRKYHDNYGWFGSSSLFSDTSRAFRDQPSWPYPVICVFKMCELNPREWHLNQGNSWWTINFGMILQTSKIQHCPKFRCRNATKTILK